MDQVCICGCFAPQGKPFCDDCQDDYDNQADLVEHSNKLINNLEKVV